MFKSDKKGTLSLTRYMALSLISIFAAGCANEDWRNNPPPDPIEIRLADYAKDASISLRQLAEVEKVVRREKTTEPVDPPALSAALTPEPRRLPDPVKPKFPAPEGLDVKSDINWNGPLEQLLVRIGDASGYKLKFYGITPRLPLYVVIKPNDTDTLMDVLVDASQQAGPIADIVVKPNVRPRLIELRYVGLAAK